MTGFETPFYNPGNRTMKYYYWANALIGVNPAANCVLFSTDAGTGMSTIEMTVSGIAFDEPVGGYEVEIGGELQLKLALTGSITDADGANVDGRIAVEPDAAMFEVAASRTTAAEDPDDPDVVTAVPLNSRTYVDNYGILHVQKSGLEVGDVITVSAKSVYLNPSGATTVYDDSAEVEIIAPVGHGAKECAVATDPFITYTDETDSVTASE